MRTEQEMLEAIINTAKVDNRVRAVYMNGSRANPKIIKDDYQDYDIVFVVTEMASFMADKSWLDAFGEIAIVQEPDWNDMKTGLYDGKYDTSRRYAWLMLFKDGNRIDITILIKEDAEKGFLEDKLAVLLLDKDNFLPEIPPPTDEDYYIKKPTQDAYTAYCNNFWWCLQNVAKGIARDELPYAMEMYNSVVRELLNGMIDWYIGTLTGFSVSAGKMGKYYKKYLPPEMYALYAKTYSDSDYDNLWDAVFVMCRLFHSVALSVGEHFNFTYRQHEENAIIDYLNKVKTTIMSEQSIEYFINETLAGEARKNAHDFIAYLRADGLSFERCLYGFWEDKLYWVVKYKNEVVCQVFINGYEAGHWVVWSDDSGDNSFSDFPLDEDIKEVVWRNVGFCGGGGCCRDMGTRKVVFGKVFDNVCLTVLRFDNPNAEAVACMKKMVEIRKAKINLTEAL
jgi:aminoglycoside 6-adenylyltransferase